MKKSVLLAAALGCLFQTQAQMIRKGPENPKLKAHRAMVNNLVNAQFNSGVALKPTGTQYRVIAQAAQEIGEIADSNTFKYSGTKGSKYNYDNLDFTYSTSFSNWYAPRPTFSMMDNPLDMLADTIKGYYNDTMHGYTTATYRSDNKIINSTEVSLSDPPAPSFYWKTANVYNTQGHVITSYQLRSTDNGATYNDTNRVTHTSYNSAFTRALVDSIYEKTGLGLELNTLVHYYYNSTNKADSIVTTDVDLIMFEKVVFDYYTDGKLRKVTTTNYDGFIASDSFGYTTGINYTTLWQSKQSFEFEGEIMTFGSRTIKYPGSGGLPDSLRAFDYEADTDTWSHYLTGTYSYTSFNAPQKLSIKDGDGTPLGSIRFYYEPYDDGIASVKPLAENKDFNIYPNPFRNNISIDWKGKAQSAVNVRLVNILGQEVYNASLKLNTGSNTIDLPALNSGNYILVIRDAAGKAWSSKVVKQ